MSAPTKTAAAGQYQSRTGEDFIQFKNASGEVVAYIDINGVLQIHGVAFADGTYQASAASTTGSNVDSGTF